MKFLQRLGVLAALAIAPMTATAATDIDLGIYEKTGVSISLAPALSFFVTGVEFSAFETTTATFLSAFDATDKNSYDFSFTRDASAGLSGPSELIEGAQADVTDFLVSTNKLELIYSTVSATGGTSAVDGKAVLVSFSSSDLNSLSDGAFGSGALLIEELRLAAPIPLPAGGLLLVTSVVAFGAGGALRRQKRLAA